VAPRRSIIAEGLCALPAAIALGTTFLATRRFAIAWQQVSPKRAPQLWSLSTPTEASGFTYRVSPGDPNADDLALLVSVTSLVDPAFAASRPALPRFRGLVAVTKPGDYPHDIATAGEAADVLHMIVEGLRKARADLQPRGTVHLFLAVPAGLAMMIGQMLNTFGPIQTYEHLAMDAVGAYQPAARLMPSA
ncbi:MAG: SAVED domain-containing protein, partial [Terriglobales bacterium]